MVNGAQFLNATLLSLSSVCLAAASFPSPVIVIFPLTHLVQCHISIPPENVGKPIVF